MKNRQLERDFFVLHFFVRGSDLARPRSARKDSLCGSANFDVSRLCSL